MQRKYVFKTFCGTVIIRILTNGYILDLRAGSFVIYPDIDPLDEAKVLNLFRLTDEYVYDEEERYDLVSYNLNRTGTSNSGQRNIAPLRIKIREFRIGDEVVLISFSLGYLTHIHIAFFSDNPPTDTERLMVDYPCAPEVAFHKSVGPWTDI